MLGFMHYCINVPQHSLTLCLYIYICEQTQVTQKVFYFHNADLQYTDVFLLPLNFFFQWPFVQMFGLQEPASVFISIFNFISHLSVLQYRRSVSSATPMYYVWHGFAFVS